MGKCVRAEAEMDHELVYVKNETKTKTSEAMALDCTEGSIVSVLTVEAVCCHEVLYISFILL